ncbi:gliding motility-associated C-terminal domain-containing protein [Lishizhenia tianjinensis]|nr:gliding motility-associated C-terminal domain-containing protein [Lishizhenia tianjinensis]
MNQRLLTLFFALLCLPIFSMAQGLVPNPGFEAYTSCPNSIGNIAFAYPWGNATNISSSADYMNDCGYSMLGSWYSNSGTPYSGDGVGGIRVTTSDGANSYCEYLQVQLTSPLVAGQVYSISFYCYLGETTTGNANSLGVALTDSSIFNAAVGMSTLQGAVTPAFPQVKINTTGVWELVSGYYLAQGGEDYLTIGNFYTPVDLVMTSNYSHCFYLIDEVYIEEAEVCELELTNSITMDTLSDLRLCYGDSVTLMAHTVLSADSGYWSTGDTLSNITVQTSGTYIYTLNFDDCHLVDSIQVEFVNPPVVDYPDTLLCTDDTLQIINQDSSLVQRLYWMNILIFEKDSIDVTIPYGYELALVDGFCEGRDAFQFGFIDVPEIVPLQDTTVCALNAFNVTASAQVYDSLLWNTGSDSLTTAVMDTGMYIVTFYNKCGSQSDTMNLYLHQMDFTVSFTGDTLLCVEDEMEVLINGNVWSTLWNDSVQSNQRVLTAGNWWFEIEDERCSFRDSITLRLAEEFELDTDTLLCDDESISVEINEPWIDSLAWNEGSTNSITTFQLPNIYWVEVYQEHCVFIDSFSLEKLYTPVINKLDTTLCAGDQIYFNLNPEYSYTLNSEAIPNYFYLGQEGEYILDATNYCGTSTKYFELEGIDCSCNIYIPNTFTPDGDPYNNQFTPRSSCTFNQYELSIYNRWGELIFQSSDPEFNWDGSYKGKLVPEGVYVYILRYQALDEQDKLLTGHINVLK